MSGWLAGTATCAAVCARLLRRDGVCLGFTTHDRPLKIDGMRYEAAGLAPSAVVHEVGLRGGAFELAVPLAPGGVTRDDGAMGRWDGAEVRLFLVDWRAPVDAVPLALGTIDGVSMSGDGTARFTVRDPMAALADEAPVMCSPTCRASLGDADCGVDMAGRRLRVLATATGDGARVWAGAPLDGFVEGRLRVLTGPGAGLDRAVIGTDGDLLALDHGLPAGAFEAEVSEGCDRRFATCRDRFGNAAAFRGEPHVPGVDSLIRRG